jgi:hypothetical protein
MKKVLVVIFLLVTTGLSACGSETPQTNETQNGNNNSESMKIQIRIGTTTFTATLADNPTAKAFMEMLPLSINMVDLHRNEKYYDLPNNLPTDTYRPGTIRTGDIMLWGTNTLVLFYKTFSSSYSYTRIGSVDNTTELETMLGSSNVTVVFEQMQNE